MSRRSASPPRSGQLGRPGSVDRPVAFAGISTGAVGMSITIPPIRRLVAVGRRSSEMPSANVWGQRRPAGWNQRIASSVGKRSRDEFDQPANLFHQLCGSTLSSPVVLPRKFQKSVASNCELEYDNGKTSEVKTVTDRQLFERRLKDPPMLMPFQPYRDLGPAEEMASRRRARPVPVDAYRRGDELKAELDLPGADPGSIELTVENDLLSVKATRTAFWDKTDEVQVEERAYGQFGRQLFLGKGLDLKHITAIYHDGVLTVTIPVAEQAKPHKIEVTHVGSVAQAVEAASSAIRAEGEASNGSPILVGPPG